MAAFDARFGRLGALFRYYGVAAINTAFGYGVYAGIVALDVNLFAAQILSQLIGMTFNYISYGTAVFRGRRASKPAYIAAYALNWLAGLGFLAIFHAIGLSAYLAGLAALVCASLMNFFVLRRFVFRPIVPEADTSTAGAKAAGEPPGDRDDRPL